MGPRIRRAALVAGLIAVATSAIAQLTPSPEVQPGTESPRGDDASRRLGGAQPPGPEVQPGTETPRGDVTRTMPGGAPQVTHKPPPRRTGRATGDDDDIDDSEVQRRTVQGGGTPGDTQGTSIKPPAGRAGFIKAPAALPPNSPADKARTAPAATRPPIDKARAIVVPRENCGTFWTAWGSDPNANPCPANCERGERLDLREQKTADGMRYQANYRCSLPELVVNPPPAASRGPGAPPRTNCGTFWTARQDDPNSDANPCPANCERGELLDVRRGRSGDKLLFEMNYRCYVAQQPASGNIQHAVGDGSKLSPFMAPPAGPELRAVTAVSMFMLKADWKTAKGAESYMVRVRAPEGSQVLSSFAYRADATSNEMSGGVAGLTPGFTYDVWVEARYPDQRIGASAVKRASTLGPANPVGLTATLIAPGSVRLTWVPIRGAAHYVVEGSQLSEGLRTQDATATIGGVPAGRHEWRVIAVYGQGVFNDRRPATVSLVLQNAAGGELGPAAQPGANPAEDVGRAVGNAVHSTGQAVKDVSTKTGNAVGEAARRIGGAVHDAIK